jgi:hypothetical protein
MARTQRDPKTDEELIEWIKSKKTIKELRMDNYAHYQQCIKRGLKGYFPEKMTSQLKYTDEELIEWIESFDTIGEMRNDSYNKYTVSKRRKLNKYFPKKRTRCGNIAGVEAAKEPKVVRERKMKPVKETPEPTPVEKVERTKKMYKGMNLNDGNILCGRCLETKPKSNSRLICYTCQKVIASNTTRGIDTNKFNVKDYFCHTKIVDGGREFHIDLRTDERTQEYLTLIGYGFIFKEEYDV